MKKFQPCLRKPRSLADMCAHPWIADVSDERDNGEGVWIYLRAGYTTDDGCHTIHEQTIKECLRAFSYVSVDPNDYLLEDLTATNASVTAAVSRIAARDALDASASALAVADVAAAADYVANRPDVVRLPGERVAPSGSGRVARPAVSLPTIADV